MCPCASTHVTGGGAGQRVPHGDVPALRPGRRRAAAPAQHVPARPQDLLQRRGPRADQRGRIHAGPAGPGGRLAHAHPRQVLPLCLSGPTHLLKSASCRLGVPSGIRTKCQISRDSAPLAEQRPPSWPDSSMPAKARFLWALCVLVRCLVSCSPNPARVVSSLVKKDAGMLDAFGKGASDDIQAAKAELYAQVRVSPKPRPPNPRPCLVSGPLQAHGARALPCSLDRSSPD